MRCGAWWGHGSPNKKGDAQMCRLGRFLALQEGGGWSEALELGEPRRVMWVATPRGRRPSPGRVRAATSQCLKIRGVLGAVFLETSLVTPGPQSPGCHPRQRRPLGWWGGVVCHKRSAGGGGRKSQAAGLLTPAFVHPEQPRAWDPISLHGGGGGGGGSGGTPTWIRGHRIPLITHREAPP